MGHLSDRIKQYLHPNNIPHPPSILTHLTQLRTDCQIPGQDFSVNTPYDGTLSGIHGYSHSIAVHQSPQHPPIFLTTPPRPIKAPKSGQSIDTYITDTPEYLPELPKDIIIDDYAPQHKHWNIRALYLHDKQDMYECKASDPLHNIIPQYPHPVLHIPQPIDILPPLHLSIEHPPTLPPHTGLYLVHTPHGQSVWIYNDELNQWHPYLLRNHVPTST